MLIITIRKDTKTYIIMEEERERKKKRYTVTIFSKRRRNMKTNDEGEENDV